METSSAARLVSLIKYLDILLILPFALKIKKGGVYTVGVTADSALRQGLFLLHGLLLGFPELLLCHLINLSAYIGDERFNLRLDAAELICLRIA